MIEPEPDVIDRAGRAVCYIVVGTGVAFIAIGLTMIALWSYIR